MDPIFILICIYVILDMAFFLGKLLVEIITEKLKKGLRKFRDDREAKATRKGTTAVELGGKNARNKYNYRPL